MKIQKKEYQGITLISLVITIIILMILAGVTINLTIGNDGLFNMAKKAKSDYEQAITDEETGINELYEYLAREGELPENTKDTKAGTEVKLPEGWYVTSLKYVSTEDGSVVKEAKSTSVIAVAAGKGETVPVPVGFYYVGGNFSTGVVISDNKEDRYGYNPDTKQENDTTIDKTTHEYTTKLKGNQFVWIPCTESEYKKYWNGTTQTNPEYATEQTHPEYATSWWDTTTNSSELPQIQKYGGFYVARYEAGLATNISEYTSALYQNGENQAYNKIGKPQSKAGVIPWIFIDWTTSQKNARSMYNTSYVSSGLITGTQWDVMLNKIANVEGKSLTDSQSWGNHYNSSLTYTGRYATYDSTTFYISAFSKMQTNATKNASTKTLLTTGASKTTKAYNLYDVAGNAWEWSEEISFYGKNTSTQYRNTRGGSLTASSTKNSVCFRDSGAYVSLTSFNIGFRVVLYIK